LRGWSHVKINQIFTRISGMVRSLENRKLTDNLRRVNLKKLIFLISLVLVIVASDTIAEEAIKFGSKDVSEIETKENNDDSTRGEKKIKPGGVENPELLENNEVGRFQIAGMGENNLCILDTKDGHVWVCGASDKGLAMVYCGKVQPGKRFGEIIWNNWEEKK